MDSVARLAHAVQLYIEFQASPRPAEAWLQDHAPYRDLLEMFLAGDGVPVEPSGAGADGAGSGVETPPPEGVLDIERCPRTGAVERLGPYRVIEPLGEGGMGAVYLAEQTDPIQRRVALKVIRRGMETRTAIARFEAERRALARMDHPNIARVLEAGTTEDRCPYFVMEYVDGDRMTRYCDEHQFDLRARIELFARVCDGVQHAHRQGIIHRDLKPSNVLVTVVDGRAMPKIIDFGIAKAVGQNVDGPTLHHTRTGGIVGTPAFMSPEQLQPDDEPIDTRTDVYSLGVLLHELLVGELPFDVDTDSARGFAELCRVVREVDAQRPSSRVARLGDTAESTASQRATSQRALERRLRGELDWIVLRCLEKDRARRYGSASDLAADLRRFLADEPVLARPPSNVYRARKLVRRHRGLFAAASLVLLSLVVGLGWALREKGRADHKAEQLASEVYRANLLVATDAIEDRRLRAARRSLEIAPERFREWEWRHLKARLEPSLRRFQGVDGPFCYFTAVPPRGAYLMALPGGDIQYRSLLNGELLESISTPGIPIHCAASTAGDELLAVGLADRSPDARIWVGAWRLPDGEPVALEWLADDCTVRTRGTYWFDRSFRIPQCVVHADRRRAALGTTAGIVVYDLSRRAVSASRTLGDRNPALRFTPSGRHLLLSRSQNSHELVDASTLAVRARFGAVESYGVAVSGDDGRLAMGAGNGTVLVWDLTALPAAAEGGAPYVKRALRIPTKLGRVGNIAFSDEGTHIIAAGDDRSLSVWDANTGELTERYPGLENSVQAIAPVPEIRGFVTVESSGTFRFWHTAEQDHTVLRGHESFVYHVDVNVERGLIVSGGWDGYAQKRGAFRLWDLDSGDPVAAWGSRNQWAEEVGFVPGLDRLLTLTVLHPRASDTGTPTRILHQIDLTSGTATITVPHGSVGGSWHTPGDGSLVWMIDPLGQLQRLDLQSGAITAVGDPWGTRWGPHEIAITDDQRTIAIAAHGSRLVLAGLVDLQVLHELPPHDGVVTSLDFDATGRRLLSASEDGTVRVWDVATGVELARLIEHDHGVLSARFNPADTRIATGGRDRTIRIWHGETYEQLVILRGHERYVYELRWQPDGERLFSTSGDGTVRVWETTPVRDRYEARRARRALVADLTPAVDEWLVQDDGTGSFEEYMGQMGLGAEAQRVARQILLGRRLGTAP